MCGGSLSALLLCVGLVWLPLRLAGVRASASDEEEERTRAGGRWKKKRRRRDRSSGWGLWRPGLLGGRRHDDGSHDTTRGQPWATRPWAAAMPPRAIWTDRRVCVLAHVSAVFPRLPAWLGARRPPCGFLGGEGRPSPSSCRPHMGDRSETGARGSHEGNRTSVVVGGLVAPPSSRRSFFWPGPGRRRQHRSHRPPHPLPPHHMHTTQLHTGTEVRAPRPCREPARRLSSSDRGGPVRSAPLARPPREKKSRRVDRPANRPWRRQRQSQGWRHRGRKSMGMRMCVSVCGVTGLVTPIPAS